MRTERTSRAASSRRMWSMTIRPSPPHARHEALRELYIKTGQRRTDETLEQALANMLRYFADRIEREAPDLGKVKPISQPLPSSDPDGSAELTFVNAVEHFVLHLHVETMNGKK